MHKNQHQAQPYAKWWVNDFKLDIPEFQGCMQLEEFLLKEKENIKFPQKEVCRKMAKMVPNNFKLHAQWEARWPSLSLIQGVLRICSLGGSSSEVGASNQEASYSLLVGTACERKRANGF